MHGAAVARLLMVALIPGNLRIALPITVAQPKRVTPIQNRGVLFIQALIACVPTAAILTDRARRELLLPPSLAVTKLAPVARVARDVSAASVTVAHTKVAAVHVPAVVGITALGVSDPATPVLTAHARRVFNVEPSASRR